MSIANLITALIGIGLLIAFVGILVAWLKALPLLIISVLVVLLLAWDIFQNLRQSNGAPDA